jgi:hypothetical protein
MELMSESPAWWAVGLRKESSNKALALLRGRPSMMANGELRPFAADHLLLKKKSLASQEENEWPTEGQTNPFTEPERTRIVSVHQKSQNQPDAKIKPDRTTSPDCHSTVAPFS